MGAKLWTKAHLHEEGTPVNRPQRNSVFALMAFALLGVVFAAFSSYDFIAHLDRQVHSIT